MNRFFINLFKFVVNAMWYVLIPLMVIAFIGIGWKVISQGYVEWDVPVYLKHPEGLPDVQAVSSSVQFVAVNGAEAVLKLRRKLTPSTTVMVIFGFGMGMLVLFGILYQLRKIFNSLKAGNAFDLANIRRLRLISLFVLISVLVGWIDGVVNRQLLSHYFNDINGAYVVKFHWGIPALAICVAVFIVSEIFKQGYQLKSDNESFV
ncbi:DUF2975 domain-containing protein [Chitinophaga pendula]|uniref:DUF2975 domain-containing protein n=1 Tax=Chitinophaga TaxID=79328 RepID=UPI0012FD515A|nr:MULTISPECIES: DUF2975 domain-containing protein [Chitinophaga]UCJ05257.1 DUF2975 domain-containing protein [Chitinophaga pendula]